MKRFFLTRLSALLAALVLLASSAALGEAAVCPVNAPPALGQYATRLELFGGDAVDYQVTLAIDEETGMRTYTIHNPLDWGIAEAALGIWQYRAQEAPDAAGETSDVPAPLQEPGWVQTAQGGEDIRLLLEDALYANEGFPLWKAPCNGGADALSLNIYLGQLRQLYVYVDYLFGNDSISITAEDNSFLVSLTGEGETEGITGYASYDANGILAYAVYGQEMPDGGFTGWRVEAVPARKAYLLTGITHEDGQGNGFYWENGEWQNGDFEPVDAPEGIDPANPPYTIEGEWQGVPFAQPGDAPEGSFPVGEQTVDAAMRAADYRPWPEGENAVYRSWTEGKTAPAMPGASWQTGEDGTVVYTLTIPETLGMRPEDQCDWRWSDIQSDWERAGEPTPGQMRFLAPAEVTDIRWSQPSADETVALELELNRANMRQTLGLFFGDGRAWKMDNQGGLYYCRSLDENRILTVEYADDQLLGYEILTIDEAGEPVSQQNFDAPEDAPDTYSLHLYYHFSEDLAQEALWLRDIGWYSYETGKPCEGPAGVEPEKCLPLEVR